ncbi:hypothetical protein HUG10_20910 (plasmid) [Halorarum halophilum]|uniref:Uncharacterized protein n=1 Tax=Halorarum halophilum TaxID=2743090 RepID=A0A7D5GEV3_9EURY|nr:hypothetical protein [Halobaculum halophilum]QLG30052.1 hypothetical protein HUG10_20910 [Halobaculum halophilum]
MAPQSTEIFDEMVELLYQQREFTIGDFTVDPGKYEYVKTTLNELEELGWVDRLDPGHPDPSWGPGEKAKLLMDLPDEDS